jgi:dihydroorotase-like cyclic amidohydrolase
MKRTFEEAYAWGLERGLCHAERHPASVPVMIVHVSNRQAMEEIRRAQPRPTASIRARA